MKTIKQSIFVLLSSLVFSTTALAISVQCDSIATGSWSQATTWNCTSGPGTIPDQDSYVIIKTGHLVILDVDTASLSSITVESEGDLDVASPGFTLNGNSNALADNFDLQNASIELFGDLTINANGHPILLGKVDGAFGLTLNSSDETRFKGTVGGTTPLTSVLTDIDGTTVFADIITVDGNTPNFTVNGPRTFNDPILLANNITIRGIGGEILFNSTINSEIDNKLFTISNVNGDNITFNGDIGDINRLARIAIFNSVGSVVNFNISTIKTIGQQFYKADILLNSPSNTVTMESTINEVFIIGKNDSSNYLRSESTIPDSLIITTGGAVQLQSIIGDNNEQLQDLTINLSSSIELNTSTITVDNGITFNAPILMKRNSTINAGIVDFQSNVNNDGFDLTLNTSNLLSTSNIDGELSGSGNFIKKGAGKLDFYSINSLTGNISLEEGQLSNQILSTSIFPNVPVLSLAASTVATLGNNILNGNYIIGNNQSIIGDGLFSGQLFANSGAIVSPGLPDLSPGQLSADSIAMQTGSSFVVELDGTTVATEYDQLIVIDLELDSVLSGGATLDVSLGFIPNKDDQFTIIDVTSTNAVSGTFNGLAEGDSFIADEIPFSISYLGGVDSNDVVLTMIQQACVSLQTGDWSQPTTWASCNNTIPQDGDTVLISAGHLVTLDQDTALLDGLTVADTGDLDIAGNFSLLADATGANFDLQNASIDLLGDLTINAQGHNILLGTVDGAFGLTLNSTAETRFTNIIGGTIPLTSLITDLGGETYFADTQAEFNVSNIIVEGVREFNDPVYLTDSINISGNTGSIVFNSTINSDTIGQVLFITLAENTSIEFNDDIGLLNPLSRIDIFDVNNSTLALNLDQLITTGTQVFRLDILLNSSNDTVVLDSTQNQIIILGSNSNYLRSEVAGEDSLVVNTGGVVELNSVIGDSNQLLSSFTINNASNIELKSSSINADEGINFAAPVLMKAASILNADTVDFQSDVDNGGFDLTFNTDNSSPGSNIYGDLSGAGNLIKKGNGDFSLHSINSITGNLIVETGTIINKNASNSIFPGVVEFSLAENTYAYLGGGGSSLATFELNDGQTIKGDGQFISLLDVKSGATISPGFSPGSLSLSGLKMNTGSVLSIELNGTVIGSQYDLVNSSTEVNLNMDSLGGSTLDISIGFVPNINDTFAIVNLVNPDPINGTFNGLPEGSLFVVQDQLFSITYQGGSDGGNDVVITALGDPILFVDVDATPGGNGLSWDTAFDNLQDALTVADSGMEIWVADGVYYPDVGANQVNDDVFSTFNLINGIKLYGGFNGTETELSMRDTVTNVTVLSGDIDADDIAGADTVDSNGMTAHYDDLVGNNAYHVMTSLLTDETTVIDGLTITAGWAAGASPDDRGSALLCQNSTVTINDITVQGNHSDDRAALWNCSSLISQSSFINNFAGNVGAVTVTPTTFTDTLFKGNKAASQGSAFYMSGGQLNLTRVQFIANHNNSVVRVQNTEINFNEVLFSGNRTRGAIHLAGSAHGTLNNITMVGNRSTYSDGAGIRSTTSGDISINNSIFWNNEDVTGPDTFEANIDHSGINAGIITVNSSIVQGSSTSPLWGTAILVDDEGNLDENPSFILDVDLSDAPTTVGDARLQSSSIAIDTGDEFFVTSTTDLDGRTRVFNDRVDRGAYEYIEDQMFKDGFE